MIKKCTTLSIAELFPDWDDISGCVQDWMKYGVLCKHDDDVFCRHRQEHLLNLIETTAVDKENMVKE